MSKVGDRLKQARMAKGLTQEDVGRHLGVTRSVIARYESGLNDPPSENLAEMARLYGVTADWLLGTTDDPHLHSVSASDRAGVSDSIKTELQRGDPQAGDSRPPLPDWLSKLPPDMQEFVREESQHGWPYLRLARGLKMQDLSKEELEAIVETWMDAKKRHEREFGKDS